MRRSQLLFSGLFLLASSGVAFGAPVDGQVDTFDGGSLDGWTMGVVVSINTYADGGPLGAGDGYIEPYASGSAGAGGRLTIRSLQPRWTGNWTAAGIDEIDVDLRNDSGTTLEIRLELESGVSRAFTAAATVPSDGQWATYTFAVDAGSVTSTSDPAQVLANVTTLRIEHNPAGTNPPPVIAAAVGVDNVAAFDTVPTCGDGVVEGTELCDGADVGAEDCVGQGFDEGTLMCAADCASLDTSGCASCGDGACNGTEDEGSCPEDCAGGPECGDGVAEGAEVCDGADLGGHTCVSQGFVGGTLICAADCSTFYTTSCEAPSEDDGGGCETARSGGGGAGLLLLLGLLLVAVGRRRRRR